MVEQLIFLVSPIHKLIILFMASEVPGGEEVLKKPTL